MFITSFRSSYGKALLYLLVALALLVALGGSPVEAQNQNPWKTTKAFVFLWGSGSINEGRGFARLEVNRMVVSNSEYNYGRSFDICFTGGAAAGTDFYVVKKGPATRMPISSNCFTDSWGTGNWWHGATNVYHIFAISDNVSEPAETIVATIDKLPDDYMLLGGETARFTIRGN